jgi:ferritin
MKIKTKEGSKMISDVIEKALNEQTNSEFYSAYLYLSMETYFESVGLTGCAKWMRAQTIEEIAHAMKIHDFVVECGGRVILKKISEPPMEWRSALEVFEAAYAHEQSVTKRINELVDLAIKERDHATGNMLNWFVDEQVEEESTVKDIVRKFEMVGKTPGGQFLIDQELGKRTFGSLFAQEGQ